MEEFSLEKASKFRKEHRYFNINHLWAPGFMRVVEMLYYTPVRPEFVVFVSFIFGISSAWIYSFGQYHLSILAGLLIVFKNFLDNIDGHLARAKGLASRLGRFLDSLSDAFVYLFLFTGIAYGITSEKVNPLFFIYAYIAMFMAFIQCSFYNYYLVSYKTVLYGEGLNRTDESFEKEESEIDQHRIYAIFLFLLKWIYQHIYGWQDKLVTAVDKKAYDIFKSKNIDLNEKEAQNLWYTKKIYITLFSPLCFGTQIFTLLLFTVFDNLPGFLFSLIIPWNVYLIIVYFLKINFSSRPKQDVTVDP